MNNRTRRYLSVVCVVAAVVIGFGVGARLTAAGRVEEVSGEVTTKAELARAVRIAHEKGEEEGREAAEEVAEEEIRDAVDQASEEAFEAGFTDGGKDAYPIGFAEGHTAGCEQIFDGLGAERVMDFDIFHNGGNWAEYLERAGC